MMLYTNTRERIANNFGWICLACFATLFVAAVDIFASIVVLTGFLSTGDFIVFFCAAFYFFIGILFIVFVIVVMLVCSYIKYKPRDRFIYTHL